MAQYPSSQRGTKPSPYKRNLQADIQQFETIRQTQMSEMGGQVDPNAHGYKQAERAANAAGAKLKDMNAMMRKRKMTE